MRSQAAKKLFFSFLFFISITSPLFGSHQSLNKLIESFSEKVGGKNQLSFTTSLELGGDQIKEVSLFYSSKKPLVLEEARALIVEMAEVFLKDLNENAFLKPDLSPYPFTASQVDITIFFRGSNGKYAALPKIAQVSLHKGIVSFYKYQKGNFQVIQQENINKLIDEN